MYKLAKGEKLYFTATDQHCSGTHVHLNDDKSVDVFSIIDFKGKHYESKRTFKEGEIDIYHVDDIEDFANTPIEHCLSILNFHEKLYDCGVLVDSIDDF